MIRSNITGLAKLLNDFEARLRKIEKRKNGKVRGGLNTTVKQVGDDITINTHGTTGDANLDLPYIPWRLYTVVSGNENNLQKHVRSKGGLINGTLPSNINADIGNALDEDQTYFVYLEVEFSGSSIVSSDMKLTIENQAPAFELEFVKGAPPSLFRHLIGVIHKGQVVDQYLRKHLLVKPAVAYRNHDDADPDIIENYFCWDIYPL